MSNKKPTIRINSGFPVTIDILKQEQVDPGIGVYPQFVVAGNGVVLGHAVNYEAALAIVEYFRKEGFEKLPGTILEAMRKQHEKEILNANILGSKGGKMIS